MGLLTGTNSAMALPARVAPSARGVRADIAGQGIRIVTERMLLYS